MIKNSQTSLYVIKTIIIISLEEYLKAVTLRYIIKKMFLFNYFDDCEVLIKQIEVVQPFLV